MVRPLRPGLAALVLLSPPASEAASLSVPTVSMEVVLSDFTTDRSYDSGRPGARLSRSDTTNPDGSRLTTLSAVAESSGIRHSGNTHGGGTLTTESSKTFEATLHRRESTTASSWSFDSTFGFSASLDYTATSTTYGKFFFALVATNENSLSFDRYARILVDRPLAIQLSLSGAFSRGYFSDVSTSAVLLAPPFDFTGLMILPGAKNLTAGAEAVSSARLGSSTSTDYRVTATGNRDGVTYDILLAPKDPGNPETVELRWFLDYKSTLQDVGANRLTTSLDSSGVIRESLTVTTIPEPSCALVLAVGLASAGIVRSRRPGGR